MRADTAETDGGIGMTTVAEEPNGPRGYRVSPAAPPGKSREEEMRERREQMPRAYRAVYNRAVGGKNLRAAVNSFCLECVCGQIQEVRPAQTKRVRYGRSDRIRIAHRIAMTGILRRQNERQG